LERTMAVSWMALWKGATMARTMSDRRLWADMSWACTSWACTSLAWRLWGRKSSARTWSAFRLSACWLSVRPSDLRSAHRLACRLARPSARRTVPRLDWQRDQRSLAIYSSTAIPRSSHCPHGPADRLRQPAPPPPRWADDDISRCRWDCKLETTTSACTCSSSVGKWASAVVSEYRLPPPPDEAPALWRVSRTVNWSTEEMLT